MSDIAHRARKLAKKLLTDQRGVAGDASLSVTLIETADKIERLRALLKEADRLLSLSGVIFDPTPLHEQIVAELK